MPDQETASVNLTGPPEGRFHALSRAPRHSRPRVEVARDTLAGPLLPTIALDVGVGEPGQVQRLFEITRLGIFQFPANIPVGTLVSIRARELPVGTTTITIRWEPPT